MNNIEEHLIKKRIHEIKSKGGIAAVSGTPLATLNFQEAISQAKPDRCKNRAYI